MALRVSPRDLNADVLALVGSAIADDATIDLREARQMARAAVSAVENSDSPRRAAKEAMNALQVAIYYANFARSETPAQALLNGVSAQIEKARDDRLKALRPKFDLATNRTAARTLSRELRLRMKTDPNFPEMWKDGALSFVRGTKTGVLFVYDYEFLAGGAGEAEEVKALVDYTKALLKSHPSLKRFDGIKIETYGPSSN